MVGLRGTAFPSTGFGGRSGRGEGEEGGLVHDCHEGDQPGRQQHGPGGEYRGQGRPGGVGLGR